MSKPRESEVSKEEGGQTKVKLNWEIVLVSAQSRVRIYHNAMTMTKQILGTFGCQDPNKDPKCLQLRAIGQELMEMVITLSNEGHTFNVMQLIAVQARIRQLTRLISDLMTEVQGVIPEVGGATKENEVVPTTSVKNANEGASGPPINKACCYGYDKNCKVCAAQSTNKLRKGPSPASPALSFREYLDLVRKS